jgi:hypothetical protein
MRPLRGHFEWVTQDFSATDKNVYPLKAYLLFPFPVSCPAHQRQRKTTLEPVWNFLAESKMILFLSSAENTKQSLHTFYCRL